MTIQGISKIGLALSHPARVRVMAVLREEELCVCEICDALGLSQSTLSTHLRMLREAGVVSTRKEGKWIYYATERTVRRLIRSFFALGGADFAENRQIATDAERLRRRLKVRRNGCCRLGFEQAAEKKGKRTDVSRLMRREKRIRQPA